MPISELPPNSQLNRPVRFAVVFSSPDEALAETGTKYRPEPRRRRKPWLQPPKCRGALRRVRFLPCLYPPRTFSLSPWGEPSPARRRCRIRQRVRVRGAVSLPRWLRFAKPPASPSELSGRRPACRRFAPIRIWLRFAKISSAPFPLRIVGQALRLPSFPVALNLTHSRTQNRRRQEECHRDEIPSVFIPVASVLAQAESDETPPRQSDDTLQTPNRSSEQRVWVRGVCACRLPPGK